MHVIVSVCVYEFRDEILLREEECKTQVNLNFFEKWQNGKLLLQYCRPEIFYILDDETDLTVGFVSRNLDS